jgi:hypothetical protein
MSTIPRDAIATALSKKWFGSEEGKRHTLFFLTIGGKQYPVRTFLSRGSGYKDYNDTLLSQVRKQLCFDTKDQLLRFIDCDMGPQEYVDLLVKKRIIHLS